VALGLSDHTVRVWDMQTGECQYTLEGHSSAVRKVMFSLDGSRVASDSHDMMVRVWDIASTMELLCYNTYINHHKVKFSMTVRRF
jgi:WD40 repeat protein